MTRCQFYHKKINSSSIILGIKESWKKVGFIVSLVIFVIQLIFKTVYY
ncbi:protein of unknown function [Candidatus Nitrosocosmicus franklandus]|uniref:Uncharacterized protein n=1 Tax=Candidatus Nitrosocosmicus franklandianus TaxID=1798806 RepID=A0A484IHQ2_9ARCH|nr:protein of unknown function [Candidatus Nitrosocosmicus franklandus]